MRRLFVDTFYLVALLYRRDAWHDRLVTFSQTLSSDDILLTTDVILVEFLAALSNKGQHLRQEAAITTHNLLERPNVTVIPQDRMLLANMTRPCAQQRLTCYRAQAPTPPVSAECSTAPQS
jgi:predicted nucleic acid-binding protein